MSTELAVRGESRQIIHTMDDAERAARAMSSSGFFQDSKSAAQAVVKILAGQELGFGPFASMTGVHIIQGKPSIGANLMAAAVKSSGKYNYRVTQMTEALCTIDFYEGKEKVGTSTFTIDDAKKADLTGKDTWKKYAKNLLFARALSNGVRWYAPDIFNGSPVYTPEELGAEVDEEGNVVAPPVVEALPEPAKEEPTVAPKKAQTADEEYFQTTINNVEEKTGKSGKVYFDIHAAGEKFSTFDPDIAKYAMQACNSNVVVEIRFITKQQGKYSYKNITGIE